MWNTSAYAHHKTTSHVILWYMPACWFFVNLKASSLISFHFCSAHVLWMNTQGMLSCLRSIFLLLISTSNQNQIECITETWTEGVTVTNIVCTAAGLCGVLLIIGELWATGSRRTCPYKITGLTDQVYAAQLFAAEVVWPQFQSGSFVKTTSIFQNFNF